MSQLFNAGGFYLLYIFFVKTVMNLGKSQLSISYLVHSMGAMGELITAHTHKNMHIMDKILAL